MSSLSEFLDSLTFEQLSDRFNLALEGAGLGIWDWDLRDNSVQFDRRWCEMLGLDHASTPMELGTWESRVHPDDLANCYADITGYLEGKTDRYRNVHRMKHADGHWVYISDTGRVSGWDEAGKPIRFTGTHLEVTELMRARQAIERQQALLETMVRNLPNAVIMLDVELRCVAVSHRWMVDRGLTERTSEQLVVRDLLGVDASKWLEVCQRGLAGETVAEEQDTVESDDGTVRWYRWDVRPWHDANGDVGGVLLTADDISENVKSRAAVEADSRLAALGLMAGGVAHEINTPLQVISLESSMILDAARSGEIEADELLEGAEQIHKTADKLAGTVRALRTLSRDSRGDPPSEVDIDELLNDVKELCSKRFELASVKLELENLVANDVRVIGRPAELGQILLNLLNNALDAAREEPDGWVRLVIEDDGSQLRLSCVDSGPGVAPENVPKLMQPFFTTKPLGVGTGLGLSISRTLAGRLGGKLRYVRESKNTTFELLVSKTSIAA